MHHVGNSLIIGRHNINLDDNLDEVTRSTNCMILMRTTSTMNGMPVMTSTVTGAQ